MGPARPASYHAAMGWLFLPLLGLASPALAAAEPVQVAVTIADDVARVEAEFAVAAKRSVAWEVLTDYREMTRFLSSLRETRVLRRWRGGCLLRHAARFEWYFIRKTLTATLRVTQEPDRRIAFEDEGGGDFKRYAGEWRLEDSGTSSVRVHYKAEIAPREKVPAFIARAVLSRQFGEQLAELRAEILRRAATNVAGR